MTDFLQTPDKLFSKKRRQPNQSKQKMNIRETSLRKTTINCLDSFDKKKLLTLLAATKTSELKDKNIDIAIIGANDHCAACRSKKAQLFAISMRDI